MSDGDAAVRITALWQAFQDLAKERRDLRVRGGPGIRVSVLSTIEGTELIHPGFGFAVTLQQKPDGAGVDLHVTAHWAKFTAWPPESLRSLGFRSVGGQLGLDLVGGYRWAALEFDEPAGLARMLLLFMMSKITRHEPVDEHTVEWLRSSVWKERA